MGMNCNMIDSYGRNVSFNPLMHNVFKMVTLPKKRIIEFCCLNVYLRVAICIHYALKG